MVYMQERIKDLSKDNINDETGAENLEQCAKKYQELSEELAYEPVTSESVLMLRIEMGDVIHFARWKNEGCRSDSNYQEGLQVWF